MVERVAVGAELGVLDLVKEHVWNKLQEIEVVKTIFVLRINVIIYHAHHIEIGMLSGTKAEQDIDMLRYFSKSQ
jgi:hypothetical protein